MRPRLLLGWLCLQVIFISVMSDVWKADVVSEVKALVSSCVVLPCTFSYPGSELPKSRLGAMWHKQNDHKDIIYHEESVKVSDSFKGRTKLLGHLGEKNCTLEIDEVKDHDNGPFCFRIEIPDRDKYSFVEQCASIIMKDEPDEPTLQVQETLTDGVSTAFKCFMKHTCPSHLPILTWSLKNIEATVTHRPLGMGVWEVESLLVYTPTEQDDHTDITCSIKLHGGKTSAVTKKLYVKRKANILHIIIPVVAVLGTAILFGGVCFVVNKRYKKQIQELQSRNNNGVLSRLSRMSRRSYRRNEPVVHMSSKPNNCVSSVSGGAGFSKPRFPSPKSEQKSYSTCAANYDDDDYTNVGDLNVYGNV